MPNSVGPRTNFACEIGGPHNQVLIADHGQVASAICSLLTNEFPMLSFVVEDDSGRVIRLLRNCPPRWHRLIVDVDRYGQATNDILAAVLFLELQPVTCLVCGAPDPAASAAYQRMGFLAYIPKRAPAEPFARALSAALNGERSFLEASVREGASLTRRQLAVLGLTRDGHRIERIALELRMPVVRVRSLLESAIAALNASSAINAVARAIELGLLRPEASR